MGVWDHRKKYPVAIGAHYALRLTLRNQIPRLRIFAFSRSCMAASWHHAGVGRDAGWGGGGTLPPMAVTPKRSKRKRGRPKKAKAAPVQWSPVTERLCERALELAALPREQCS